jgi:hypothetical protein
MSFRFKVNHAVKVAGMYTLDGTLEEGQVRHGQTATVQTADGLRTVTVKTVAFVTPPRTDRKDVTITITAPSFPFESLAGATLVGEPQPAIKI